MPPWENVEIVQRANISKIGSRTIIKQKFLWFTVSTIVAEHTKYDPPRMFEDTIIKGPFKHWVHKHIVEPYEIGATLRDEIDYEAPFSYFGMAATPTIITPKLKKMFDYRHRVTKEWCERN